MEVIRNLEYVTVKELLWKRKLKHVDYLVLRNGCYYYPNGSPVQVLNYKVNGQPEINASK